MKFMKIAFSRISYWLPALLCAALLVFLVAQSAITAKADPQDRGRDRMERSESKIKVGEFPPDFDLPKLKFDTDKEGNPVGVISDTDTVCLSSFRGKRPMCMIMSSYT